MLNETIPRDYIYAGDRHSDLSYKARVCTGVLRPDGKCIRGKNGNMLVKFDGVFVVVVARLLRKTNKSNP